MRRKERITAVLLALVLALSAAGCSSANATTKKTLEDAQETATAQQTEAGGQEAPGESVTSMGRYMEDSVALPEGAGVLGRTMSLLEDGRLAYFDYKAGIWFSQDQGKSWKDQKTLAQFFPDRQIKYVDTAAIARDGSIAVGDHNYETDEAMVLYAGADGTTSTIDAALEDGDWIDKLFFGTDGRLYGSSLRGKVYAVDTQGQSLQLLFTAAQSPEMLAFSGKLMLALEEGGVEIYNLETGTQQEGDTVLDEFCREHLKGALGSNSDCVGAYLLGAGEGICYLACREGLYRHVLGGNVMEQLIEGSLSTFGDPSVGICVVTLLESGQFLLLHTKDNLVCFTYDPDEPTTPEKLLKVYSLEENGRLRQAISAYQKQYPDVYVSYEVGMPQQSAVTRMDALKNLNLALMGGNGPDVLLLDGIDGKVYADKGLLKDLSELLEDFASDREVFANIVHTYQTEKGTFMAPAGFSLPLLVGKEEDVSAVTDLASLADVVEKYAGNLVNTTVTGAKSAEQELSQLLSVCSPAWLSGKEVNQEALSEFLTQAKRMYDVDKAGLTPEFLERFGNYNGAAPLGTRTDDIAVGTGKIAFGLASMMLMDIGGIGHFVEEEEGYAFALWAGQDGTGFVPKDKLAVFAQTQRSVEAENFLRLFFSSQVQELPSGDAFPVNRAAFDKLCEWQDQWVGGSFHGPDGEVEFGNGWPGEQTTRRLKELVEQADHCLEGNKVLEEAVMKFGPSVLSGGISVEEGVWTIQKEVSIYLSEQG